MKINKKFHSVALASAALIIFLILVSSMASIFLDKIPRTQTYLPSITSGAGMPPMIRFSQRSYLQKEMGQLRNISKVPRPRSLKKGSQPMHLRRISLLSMVTRLHGKIIAMETGIYTFMTSPLKRKSLLTTN